MTVVDCKGPSDPHAAKWMARFIAEIRYLSIVLKIDAGQALHALLWEPRRHTTTDIVLFSANKPGRRPES